MRGPRSVVLDGDPFDESELVEDGPDAFLCDRLNEDGGKERALLGRRGRIVFGLRGDGNDCIDKLERRSAAGEGMLSLQAEAKRTRGLAVGAGDRLEVARDAVAVDVSETGVDKDDVKGW